MVSEQAAQDETETASMRPSDITDGIPIDHDEPAGTVFQLQ